MNLPRTVPGALCRRRWSARRMVRPVGTLAVLMGVLARSPAHAQYVQSLFPTGVPGYDAEGGVTVLSRMRSSYDAEPVRVGDFDIRPEIDETASYDSNVQGGGGGGGSPVAVSHASLAFNSDWARDSLGASFSLDDSRYSDLPVDDHLDWSAAIGGSYTLGEGALTLGYAHLAEHELGAQFGALAATNAVPRPPPLPDVFRSPPISTCSHSGSAPQRKAARAWARAIATAR